MKKLKHWEVNSLPRPCQSALATELELQMLAACLLRQWAQPQPVCLVSKPGNPLLLVSILNKQTNKKYFSKSCSLSFEMSAWPQNVTALSTLDFPKGQGNTTTMLSGTLGPLHPPTPSLSLRLTSPGASFPCSLDSSFMVSVFCSNPPGTLASQGSNYGPCLTHPWLTPSMLLGVSQNSPALLRAFSKSPLSQFSSSFFSWLFVSIA